MALCFFDQLPYDLRQRKWSTGQLLRNMRRTQKTFVVVFHSETYPYDALSGVKTEVKEIAVFHHSDGDLITLVCAAGELNHMVVVVICNNETVVFKPFNTRQCVARGNDQWVVKIDRHLMD